MEEILPLSIDNVLIRIKDGSKELITPLNMTSEQFAKWKESKGGIFTKDVHRWIFNKEYGKYVLVSGITIESKEKYEAIYRLISDEELPDLEARGLIEGQLADKKFVEIKILTNSNDKDGYIKETNLLDEEDQETMNLKPNHIPLDDEEASSSQSISLFDD
jgi:hypothetical protein